MMIDICLSGQAAFGKLGQTSVISNAPDQKVIKTDKAIIRINDSSGLAEEMINQPEKGPRFHSDEFMRQYKSGFNDCSKVITSGLQNTPGNNTEQLQSLSTCKDQVVQAIGEINTSPSGHGLKINVDISGSASGSHPARIIVAGPSDKSSCYDTGLTSAGQSILFYFYPGLISNGQQFEACITLLDTNKKNCVNGFNHAGRQHELVQLQPPS